MTIKSDAPHLGWGSFYKGESTVGRWTQKETEQHINILEMRAALFALKALCYNVKSKHIRIKIDNPTAVTYINNMGGGGEVATPFHVMKFREKYVFCVCKQISVRHTFQALAM
jgi:hypothetical protein